MNTFNKEAIFSDETKQFVIPNNPKPNEPVKILIRVDKNDELIPHLVVDTNKEPLLMEIATTDDLFDYYQVIITAPDKMLRYHFIFILEKETLYYNKSGICTTNNPLYDFRLISNISIPEWARGAVMYHIFIDRFCNGDITNDVVNHEYVYLGVTAKSMSWDSDVKPFDVGNFRGGDLRGIINKFGYLKSLGIQVLFLSPVFVSPSNHKYDIQDYDYIDPHIGVIVDDGGDALQFEKVHNRNASKYQHRTVNSNNLEASNMLMAELIQKAHENGMRVIMDGVFNHCGCFNKWMDTQSFYKNAGYLPGAYHDPNSPYKDYFLWHKQNKNDWPKNESYDGWWDNPNHPKLNFEDSDELRDYILEIAKKWVSPPYNADGWRLDVAADLGRSRSFNHEFWQRFRDAVKSVNPDAIILAEHYGDPSSWLMGNEWDTVMNYDAFMEPITWFLTGVCKHSEETRSYLKNNAIEFESAMRNNMANLNIHALQTAMNQLSNHDHSRFLTRTNGATGRLHTVGPRAAEVGTNINIMMEAIVIQMTWPGAPCIYYGDEAGLMGWTDPDSRRTFPWGKENKVLTELHRHLIGLRHMYPVLKTGSLEFLWTHHGFLSYARWDNKQKIIVAINNNPKPMDVVIPVWKLGIVNKQLLQLVSTCDGNFQKDSVWHTAVHSELCITVPALSAMILG